VVDVIGLYGAITGGTQDSLAMFDVPSDGFLIGIDWDFQVDLDADGETSECELSFIATNQLSTSDVRGRISSVRAGSTVLTAVGGHTAGAQKWLSGFDISVAGGERMFVHVVSDAGVVGVVRCNIYLDQPGSTRRSARRR